MSRRKRLLKYVKSKYAKKQVVFITIFLLLTSTLIALYNVGFLSHVNSLFLDSLYGDKDSLDNIIIVSIDDYSISKLGRYPWNRSLYGDFLNFIGEEKVVAFDITFFDISTKGDDLRFLNSMKGHNVVLASEFTHMGGANEVKGTYLEKPFDEYNYTGKSGYVNIITDRDGITRRVNLNLSSWHNESHFAYEIFKEGFHLKRTQDSDFIINYVNKPYSFKTISFVDVIEGRVARSEFRDKIVLVGATSYDLHDVFFVPTSDGTPMPGVEVHANIIQTLLNKNSLEEQSPLSVWIGITLSCFIMMILAYFLKPHYTIPAMLLSVVGFEILAINLFDQNILVNFIYVPMTIISSFLLFNTASYMVERRRFDFVQNAFSKYLHKDVVHSVLHNVGSLNLGGVEKKITVFFMDIRGFTTISEKLNAHDIVKMLNEYFQEMTGIIMEYNGVVDKFIGDCIMAFWGAPNDDGHQENNSVLTSIEMLDALDDFKKRFKDKYDVDFDIGIGINTGKVIVGNMGCEERFDYTIIGDDVNLASRVEGLTKQYGVKILITENTRKHLDKEIMTRMVDLVSVKGKKKPVLVHEVLGLEKNIDHEIIKHRDNYNHAFDLYKESYFIDALKVFKKAKTHKSDDLSTKIMIKRCEEFIKNPPKEFDGSYVSNKK